ncbi:hypothetical protein NVP2117O_12 [Vibrio phage 2.117.O._10N.261.45.E9]|nr:hypothetical protein NVP1117O_12 [Vibrio phage 1.117.O._10N.261.45.E9]AUR95413.1 hypothetical protein NVP1207B_06 [Vibrio phage 1.207.B._10N.222.51.C2]AUS02304.1 hypothetical protein NVP2117O_12 [Vibrio phage 2.117.O._10N.261.45.E9]
MQRLYWLIYRLLILLGLDERPWWESYTDGFREAFYLYDTGRKTVKELLAETKLRDGSLRTAKEEGRFAAIEIITELEQGGF